MSVSHQQLKLIVNQSPEVLERILRVIRHRGFKIEQLDWQHASGQLILTVSSQRAMHLLTAQLIKLVDVQEVIVLDALQVTKSA